MVRSFGATDYQAVMRYRDPQTRSIGFRTTTCAALTRAMRKKDNWFVAGWKVHLSIYPGDFARVLPALRLFEASIAATGLVYKYAASQQLYRAFAGEVRGKFATVYCKVPTDVRPIVYRVNQLFTQEGITPVSRTKINQLAGLRYELPMTGGYCFVRYGAFCCTPGILDLTDADRPPFADDRRLPFPAFRNPDRLAGELEIFKDLIQPPRNYPN
jgi:hypothetical protein